MIAFKIYYNKDKEEVWLNQMSAKGYALKKFFLGFYIFEECLPGKYRYQIDLLSNIGTGAKDYAEFMEENGVEIVSRWFLWMILRREAADGSFEMYSDPESKAEHYIRIRKLMIFGLAGELLALIFEIAAFAFTGNRMVLFLIGLIGFLVWIFICSVNYYTKMINELRR